MSSVFCTQALQGLPGYGGSENGIGIGLGLQQLAQARAQAHFSCSAVCTDKRDHD